MYRQGTKVDDDAMSVIAPSVVSSGYGSETGGHAFPERCSTPVDPNEGLKAFPDVQDLEVTQEIFYSDDEAISLGDQSCTDVSEDEYEDDVDDASNAAVRLDLSQNLSSSDEGDFGEEYSEETTEEESEFDERNSLYEEESVHKPAKETFQEGALLDALRQQKANRVKGLLQFLRVQYKAINQAKVLAPEPFQIGDFASFARCSLGQDRTLEDFGKVPKARDFDFVELLGNGTKGRNYLAKHRLGSGLFSVRLVHKNKVTNALHKKIHNNEQHILSNVEHPFILKYYCSFQTSQHLFMATEFLSGGSLHKLVHANRGLREDVARTVLAEVASALAFLHANSVLHGNIRPENIRFDADGHVRLVSFNYAQYNFPHNMTAVRPVTNDGGNGKKKPWIVNHYEAPEVKLNFPYGHPSDLYSFGALSFFVLMGMPPTNRGLVCPGISPQAKHLLDSLLSLNAHERPKASEVLRHPFFASINWRDLNSKSAPAADEVLACCRNDANGAFQNNFKKQEMDTYHHKLYYESPVVHDKDYPGYSHASSEFLKMIGV